MESYAVLVVEDDATLARAISRNLAARGYTAIPALSVREAVDAIGLSPPELVVLDIDLPDGSGWDVARELRRSGEQTPIIVISALRPNHQLIKELACVGFLEKPFPMDALIRTIELSLHPGDAGAA